MRWIMPLAAKERLELYQLNQRSLISAIRNSGAELVVIRDQDEVRDLPHDGEPCIFYGGHGFLDHVTDVRPDLISGVFHEKVLNSQRNVSEGIGDLLLNHDAVITDKAGVIAGLIGDTRFFIRPDLGNKAFSGMIVSGEDADLVRALDCDAIVMAPLKEIIAEYRFVICDGKPITGCQYKRGVIDVRVDVEPDCEEMAMKAAGRYAPSRLFVCDVAQTPDGPKVIEYNSFGSAGFYACDGREIVRHAQEVVLDTLGSALPDPQGS